MSVLNIFAHILIESYDFLILYSLQVKQVLFIMAYQTGRMKTYRNWIAAAVVWHFHRMLFI